MKIEPDIRQVSQLLQNIQPEKLGAAMEIINLLNAYTDSCSEWRDDERFQNAFRKYRELQRRHGFAIAAMASQVEMIAAFLEEFRGTQAAEGAKV